jgi:hypothetical protein
MKNCRESKLPKIAENGNPLLTTLLRQEANNPFFLRCLLSSVFQRFWIFQFWQSLAGSAILAI